jgi:hypothetical protein
MQQVFVIPFGKASLTKVRIAIDMTEQNIAFLNSIILNVFFSDVRGKANPCLINPSAADGLNSADFLVSLVLILFRRQSVTHRKQSLRTLLAEFD